VRIHFKILAVACRTLLAVQVFVVARAAVEPVPAALRELAARAAKPAAWPELRRYAESQKSPEPRALAFFVLGYREYEAGEWREAAQDLRESATPQGFLADYATYYSASAAFKANDPGQAAETIREFSNSFPESPLRLQAIELLAQALMGSQKPQEAIQVLTAEPSVRQHPEPSLLLAQAYEQSGDPLQAARAFQDVYYAFPAFPAAQDAGQALERLHSALGSNFPQVTEDIETARLELLFKASLFTQALKGYEELLASKPSSAHAGDWQLGRARCLLRLRRDAEALTILSANLSTPAWNAERLALMVEAYTRGDDSNSTLAALAQIQAIDAHSTSYESALYSAGGFYFRLGDWQNASHQYQTLLDSFPQGSHVQDAGWRLIWCYYLAGQHDQALRAFQAYILQYPRSSHTPAAIYWLGRLQEEQGQVGDAQALYSLLRNRFAHGFYAEQANLRERKLPGARPTGMPTPTSIAGQLAQAIPPRNSPSIPSCSTYEPAEVLQPVLDLRALSLDGLAEEYLRASLGARPQQPQLRLYLSRLEAGRGDVTAGLFDAGKIAPDYPSYQFSELPKEMWNLLFPQTYWRLVQRQARLSGLDPYLVMGLIRQESAFNAHATSSANAHGLMQILPTTASRSKRASKVRYAGQRLYNPTYNIRFGCVYLRSLLKDFDGKPELALAAYNAGDFRVRDWTKTSSFHDSSEFLEAIPIHATRAYVEAVLRDAAIYRQLLTGAAKFAACGK
jgi:soluble lytic murein transglycosylase